MLDYPERNAITLEQVKPKMDPVASYSKTAGGG